MDIMRLFKVVLFIGFLTFCNGKSQSTHADSDDLARKTMELKRQALKIMELKGIKVSKNVSVSNASHWLDIQMTEHLYQNIKSSFDEEQKLLESDNEEDRTTAPDFNLIPLAKWSMPIKYITHNIQTESLKTKIRDALNEIQSKSGCITFVEVNQKPDGSHIDFHEASDLPTGVCANSPLGRVESVNNINIATTCQSYGAVIHEVLHSLGFAHTQQRPDADQFLEFKWDNMVPDFQFAFKPWSYALKNQGPFDYGSIMMYPSTAFSRNGEETITPKRDPENNRKIMGTRDHLSNEDIIILKKIYCGDNGQKGSQSCGKQDGKDISENDLYFVNGKPESDCCELCASESRCKAYAWNDWEGGTCYLKSASAPVVDKAGVKLGIPGAGGSGPRGCEKHGDSDISEHDLSHVSGKPESECCAICSKDSKCKAYAWNDFEYGTCWLKSDTGPIVSKPGVKVGIMGSGDAKQKCTNSERSCTHWQTKGYCKQESIFYPYVSQRCPQACKKC